MDARTAKARALSMVETVVVVAVGLVLIAGAAWAVMNSRERARSTACKRMLDRYGSAIAAYVDEYGGVLPYENLGDQECGHVVWYDSLEPYMGTGDRMCPSVDQEVPNYREGYRINSRLGWRDESKNPIYRRLDTLPEPAATVLLFDAQYGGKKLSMKGKLNDVEYRHSQSANLLMADGHSEGFDKDRLHEASNWIPPKVIWNPDRVPTR